MDFTNTQVQAAVLSILGVLVSVLATLYIARRNIHKDARSRARVEWMTALRTSVSELVVAIDQSRRARIDGALEDLTKRAENLLRAQAHLLLLLDNTSDHSSLATKIKNCVSSVLNTGLQYNPEPDIAEIVEKSRQILGKEWSMAANGK